MLQLVNTSNATNVILDFNSWEEVQKLKKKKKVRANKNNREGMHHL